MQINELFLTGADMLPVCL